MAELNSRILLTSQRNHVFSTIQNRGISPTDFEFKEIKSDDIETCSLVHLQTGYFFDIDLPGHVSHETFDEDSRPAFQATFSPGSSFRTESHGCYAWSDVLQNLELWISYMIRETETPDLWAGLEADNQLIKIATEQPSDNLPFTQVELPQVRKCLEDIKAYVVRTNEFSETQKKIIDARFKHMEEAATRMGRKDWTSLVIGNLVSIVITLAFSGDSTRDLFRFAGEVVRKILGAMLFISGPH